MGNAGSKGSKSIIDVFIGILVVFGYLALATAVASILYRLHQAALTPHKIIVNTFRSIAENNENMDRFTVEVREQVAKDIDELKKRMKQLEDEKESYRAPLSHFPTPLFQSGQEQSHMQSLAEEGAKHLSSKISWIPQFISFLFPAKSTQISCTFLDLKDGKKAISFEIVDTDYRAPTVIGTIETEKSSDYTELTLKLSEALAIEIIKQDKLDFSRLPFLYKFFGRPWKRKRYQAQIYNAIGVLYMTYAKALHDNGFFYKHAIENFQAAINVDRTWCFPYANLADMHSIKGAEILKRFNPQVSNTQKSLEEARELQLVAQSEYDQALAYLNKSLIRKKRLEDEQKYLRKAHEMIRRAQQAFENSEESRFTESFGPIAHTLAGVFEEPFSSPPQWTITQNQSTEVGEIIKKAQQLFKNRDEKAFLDYISSVYEWCYKNISEICENKILWSSKDKWLDYRTRIAKSRAKLLEAETCSKLNNNRDSSCAIKEALYEFLLLGNLRERIHLQEANNGLGKLKKVQLLWFLASWYAIACAMNLGNKEDTHGFVGNINDRLFRLLAYCLVRSTSPLSKYRGSDDRNCALIDCALGNIDDQRTPTLEDPSWYYWRRVDSDPDFSSIPRPNLKSFKRELGEIMIKDNNLLKNCHNDLSKNDDINLLIEKFAKKPFRIVHCRK